MTLPHLETTPDRQIPRTEKPAPADYILSLVQRLIGWLIPVPVIATSRMTATATTLELSIGPVPPGEVWAVHYLSVIDETSVFSVLKIILSGRGYDHFIADQNAGLANQVYWIDTELPVPEGMSITARLTGVTINDKCGLYVTGYKRQARRI